MMSFHLAVVNKKIFSQLTITLLEGSPPPKKKKKFLFGKVFRNVGGWGGFPNKVQTPPPKKNKSFFDPNFTFCFPKSHKIPRVGCGKTFPPKKNWGGGSV